MQLSVLNVGEESLQTSYLNKRGMEAEEAVPVLQVRN